MSRVYFHSPSGEAELWGGEHHWLHNRVTDTALAALDLERCWERWLGMVDASGHCAYLAHPAFTGGHEGWLRALSTVITINEDAFRWKGAPFDVFSLKLNTALDAGGPMTLAARIAGQAEVHGFCEGSDRAWLAGLIDEGLESGAFRRNTGYPERNESWEHVTAFLRSCDDEPVVMSYSVCDSFPNRRAAGWEPPPGTDLTPDWAKEAPGEWAACDYKDDYYDERKNALWCDLGHDEQWRTAMDGIRANPGRLRLAPGDWDDFGFGHGLSAADLTAPDYAERLDRALKVEAAATT